MTGSLFVLLPPSEAKNSGGWNAAKRGSFDAALATPRKQMVVALGELLETGSQDLLEGTLKVRGPLLQRALESSWEIVEGRAPILPGWQRYSGVVWSHLEPERLNVAQRRRIFVPSGLYGIASAEDPVADYRLKMNVTLSSVGNVAAFWRAHLTPVLLQRLKGATVVNLLPKEHAAAIELEELASALEVVTIAFVDNEGAREVGHAAKAVKGLVARELLAGGLDSLESFEWRGWRARRRDGQLQIVAPRT